MKPASQNALLQQEPGKMICSVLSYPERGPWGSNKWRGNLSGFVYRDLFQSLKPATFVDPMVGSGTSVEVARQMGIEAYGLDLHSGFNVLRNSIRDAVGKQVDCCISHPPYHDMVVYSGKVWGHEAHEDDLSRCASIEEFYEKMVAAIMNQRSAVKTDGYYGTIVGDLRRNGNYYSIQAELQARMDRREYASTIIKTQHNTTSGYGDLSRLSLPPIMHEYILLWKKKGPGLMIAIDQQMEQRRESTWNAVVRAALVALKGEADLPRLYQVVATSAPDKLEKNSHWEARVRATLQTNPSFESAGSGRWRLRDLSVARHQQQGLEL